MNYSGSKQGYRRAQINLERNAKAFQKLFRQGFPVHAKSKASANQVASNSRPDDAVSYAKNRGPKLRSNFEYFPNSVVHLKYKRHVDHFMREEKISSNASMSAVDIEKESWKIKQGKDDPKMLLSASTAKIIQESPYFTRQDEVWKWFCTNFGVEINELSRQDFDVIFEELFENDFCLEIFSFVVSTDLRKIVTPTSQASLCAIEDGISNFSSLKGPVTVQLLSYRDVRKPLKTFSSQDSFVDDCKDEQRSVSQNMNMNSLLLFKFHDGRRTIRALEYMKCDILRPPFVLPGAKFILARNTPLSILNGILLLCPTGIEYFGGIISTFPESAAMKDSLDRQFFRDTLKNGNKPSTGPPKFCAFISRQQYSSGKNIY